MKICLFGSFDPMYGRNFTLPKYIEAMNYKPVILNDRRKFFVRATNLFFKAMKTDFDLIVVLYPTVLDAFVAKLVCVLKRKPLIIDHLIYVAESAAEYGEYEIGSFKDKLMRFIEKTSCSLADLILVDTYEKILFFEKEFGFSKDKYDFVVIGGNKTMYHKVPFKKSAKFEVLFYGKVMPIQGFPSICEAAFSLKNHKDIHFTLIGTNRGFRAMRDKFKNQKNMTFLDTMSEKELAKFICSADITLNQFGAGSKGAKAISNKIFALNQLSKPVISGESPAYERYWKHKESIYFVKRADAKALADAILELKENSSLRKKIAVGGHKVFEKNFSFNTIKNDWKRIFDKVLNKK